MPECFKKILQDSQAYPFQQIIFLAIDEDRFEVLYSDKPSRPNSPVNVITGALILKEIFGLSDPIYDKWKFKNKIYNKEINSGEIIK